MGNCSQKTSAAPTANKAPKFIRIMSDSGQVMDLPGPIMVRVVLDDFPSYGLYQRGQLSLPMFEDELLYNGQVYYLLPFGVNHNRVMTPFSDGSSSFKRDGHNSSFEVLPSKGNGIWRVKMAIDSRELGEMLTDNAEALIEMMRSAARSAEPPSPSLKNARWRLVAAKAVSSGLKNPAGTKRLTAC